MSTPFNAEYDEVGVNEVLKRGDFIVSSVNVLGVASPQEEMELRLNTSQVNRIYIGHGSIGLTPSMYWKGDHAGVLKKYRFFRLNARAKLVKMLTGSTHREPCPLP